MNRKIILLILLIILFVSCSNTNLLEKYNCSIIETEKLSDVTKILSIRAQNQLSEDELKEIALYLRSQNKKFERLLILYYLPDMEVGTGAWASTHFWPKLEILIQEDTKNEKLEKYNCNIIETEQFNNVKKILTIRAQNQLSEDKLKELALYLRSQNKNYERLYIFY